jgi:hypothetical protein
MLRIKVIGTRSLISEKYLLWVIAGTVFVFWALLALPFYPVTQNDVVCRYGPMAEAFAQGNWIEAFHPRFGVLFQILSGAVVWSTGLDGVRACQLVSIFFFALGVVPLYKLLRVSFNSDKLLPLIGVIFYVSIPDLFSYAMSGLRDTVRMAGLLFYTLGVVDLLKGGKGFYSAIGIFLLGSIRVDCYVIAIVGMFAFIILDIYLNKWKMWRSGLIVSVMIFVTLMLSTMNYCFTGYFVPIVRAIKIIERIIGGAL